MSKILKKFFIIMLCTAAIVTGIALILICRLLGAPLSIPAYSYPYANEESDDPNDYRIINKFLEEILLYEDNIVFLPGEIQVRDDTRYYYRYIEDAPKSYYTLYLEQSYDTEKDFEAEVFRIKSLPYKNALDCGDVEYIIFSMPDEKSIAEYINYGKTNQALYPLIKCYAARADNSSNRVTYLIFYENDYTRQKEVVVEFLKEYLEDIGASSSTPSSAMLVPSGGDAA